MLVAPRNTCLLYLGLQPSLCECDSESGPVLAGYVIACALLRLVDPSFGITNVPRALRRFAEARAPGIYKDEYINDLFKYHHERR